MPPDQDGETNKEKEEKEKLPISDVKDVAILAGSLGVAVDKSLADKKFTTGDMIYFVKPMMKMPKAIEGANKIPAQLADMDPAEGKEVCDAFAEEFECLSRGRDLCNILPGNANDNTTPKGSCLEIVEGTMKKVCDQMRGIRGCAQVPAGCANFP